MAIKITSTFKLIVLAIAATFIASTLRAQSTGHDSQNTWRFGIGVEPGIPTNDMRSFSRFALSGTARIQYDIKGSVSLMVTSGYTNFFARTFTYPAGGKTDFVDYRMVPVKAGIKAFLVPHAYISGEVGAGFETNENAFNGYNKNTKLILSPGIGYSMSGAGLDLGVRYENYSGGKDLNYGLVALRVAYGFKL